MHIRTGILSLNSFNNLSNNCCLREGIHFVLSHSLKSNYCNLNQIGWAKNVLDKMSNVIDIFSIKSVSAEQENYLNRT